jgi:hypothetical protein
MGDIRKEVANTLAKKYIKYNDGIAELDVQQFIHSQQVSGHIFGLFFVSPYLSLQLTVSPHPSNQLYLSRPPPSGKC